MLQSNWLKFWKLKGKTNICESIPDGYTLAYETCDPFLDQDYTTIQIPQDHDSTMTILNLDFTLQCMGTS